MQKEKVDVAANYESVVAWSKRSGMKLGAIYARLASGDLRAIKVGRRTLIDVPHGLEWLDANRWKPSGPVSKRSPPR